MPFFIEPRQYLAYVGGLVFRSEYGVLFWEDPPQAYKRLATSPTDGRCGREAGYHRWSQQTRDYMCQCGERVWKGMRVHPPNAAVVEPDEHLGIERYLREGD
jgi:hypothetical protein